MDTFTRAMGEMSRFRFPRGSALAPGLEATNTGISCYQRVTESLGLTMCPNHAYSFYMEEIFLVMLLPAFSRATENQVHFSHIFGAEWNARTEDDCMITCTVLVVKNSTCTRNCAKHLGTITLLGFFQLGSSTISVHFIFAMVFTTLILHLPRLQ